MNPPAPTFGEYPPLLPFGLHRHSVAQVRALCVDSFPRSSTRENIMRNLEIVVDELKRAGVAGELWVDGSFLTEKIDPNDVDIVFHGLIGRAVDPANEAHSKVMWWLHSNLRASHRCDSYICLQNPPGLPQGQTNREYWQKQFGYSRGTMNKGIAVIEIGGGL